MSTTGTGSWVEPVDDLLLAGTPFSGIEDYIEGRTDLHPEAKSVLWLYAWVETDRRERRKAVGELIAGVGHSLY